MRQKSHCQGKKCPIGIFVIVPKRSEIANKLGEVQDYILGKVFVIIISRSAHRTPNFTNPEFQFPQLKVLQSVFLFFLI